MPSNFFSLLFDLSFSKFIGIRIIGLIYGVGGIFIFLISLTSLINGFQAGQGLLAFLLSPVLFLSLLISFRIVLEGFVASLKTAENTSELVEHFKRLP
ncbi:MAG: DUF4282 domain-containing protein [Microcystis aeruginosa Ma_QC_B_20070730_S2]|jgi:hypothetical protein|uniref:DUF4282 domain-containing protein n=1 Tax=Microcystis aeruginosa Ma_QC_B_20070730_S2 TaxID=2486256 RepID=A0A552E7U5_MICAE|nr:MAG: DUF4282 domain-containing protein [Microcystis aeruginosa Ma_QC_B_20070730_S2]